MQAGLNICHCSLTLATILALGTPNLLADETGSGRLPVIVLTNLARGISLDELTAQTGIKPRHQFSARFKSNDALCVSISFERPRGSFYFLFNNGRLAAVQDPPKIEFETRHFSDGTPWKIPKPVDAEERMIRVIEGHDLSATEIVDRLQHWASAESAAAQGKEPWNILPAVLITSPLMLAKSPAISRANKEAEELATKFDPFKIRLGTTTNEVQAIFGETFQRISDGANRLWHIYGSALPPQASVQNPPVWVSVSFCGGRVSRVFSDDFFEKHRFGIP